MNAATCTSTSQNELFYNDSYLNECNSNEQPTYTSDNDECDDEDDGGNDDDDDVNNTNSHANNFDDCETVSSRSNNSTGTTGSGNGNKCKQNGLNSRRKQHKPSR